MKAFVRGSAVLLATAAAMAALPQAGAQPGKPAAAVQDKKMLSTDRDKVSYAIGMDVGSSFKPIATDVDFAALEKAVRNAFDGGKPLISQEDAKVTDTALRARVAARDGTPTGKAPGAAPPAVDKAKVGLMLGSYMVGPSLTPIKDEIDLPLLMQGMHAGVGETAPLLPQEELRTVLERFGAQMKARMEAKASAAAETNRKEGAEFLSKNKATKGVIVLPSGLQYMVLREGAGARPKPSDRVRVNYHGTLLDGTVFDSSYDRGQPAEFALNQVIAGWTEGVALMPVGAKYRFWIPGDLAYGAKGTPGGPIGPNATLVFDVELMAIL